MKTVLDSQDMHPEINSSNAMQTFKVYSKIFAHDFNNLLTVMVGSISLAKIFVHNNKDEVIRLLDNVERACNHAQDLVQHLSRSSDLNSFQFRKVNLNKILPYTVQLCLTNLKTEIEYEIKISDNLWPIHAYEVQIIQVLTNLLMNSVQAMPDGGLITIEAENVVIDDTNGKIKKGNYVKLSIKDNGIGIPEEILPRIFDLHFTTQREGKGLGLYIIKEIVTKHQGYISVISNVGIGTTFSIYLPALNENDF